ncbi:MAG: aminotransferase class V-fold PLP-dependent enzyme [Ruminococcaceae bacterium]|nr:aminotransferase class V-fold PLP-dependent enzyme [Oscillospiraceae bacterium]
MDTPICEFVNRYHLSSPIRLHMPGHKGQCLTGLEHMDITEIEGADSLYHADGIIKRSEENASRLFGCPTIYSTEGSSLCIRTMLHLVLLHGGENTVIAAARNVHSSFVSAAAMLDLKVRWLYPSQPDSYLSCKLDAMELEIFLINERPTALYITSPDYLGNIADIEEIANICHRHNVLLLVDNAHGAYLRFINPSLHPMTLGADLCCSSAHKTLPALTGAAYLHIAQSAPPICYNQAKNVMALHGTTSPSYLILQSLDMVNVHLVNGYRFQLKERIRQVRHMKERLMEYGYALTGDEPMKVTILAKAYGYTGIELAGFLRQEGIYCEYADPDHLVMMMSPAIDETQLQRVSQVLADIPRRLAITEGPPAFHQCEQERSIREAMLAPCRTVPADHALGRILASPSVGCPPAVPIAICGERIDLAAVQRFRYYGIQQVTVMSDYGW